MAKPIDRSKKTNIKCEHCEHYSGMRTKRCSVHQCEKEYYLKCKSFEWRKDATYKEEAGNE